jgi:hypothetical protein
MKREVEVRPAFAAAVFSLSRAEQKKVERVLYLLSFSPRERPGKLSLFKSSRLPRHFIVRIDRDLRLIYHRPKSDRVVVKDLYRRSQAHGPRDSFGGQS